MRRREGGTTPTGRRRFSNDKKSPAKDRWVSNEPNRNQMNAKRRQKRSAPAEDQRKTKNTRQRRTRSKGIRDPLKRALAEGKDIFVNRQGKRFRICDCQKGALFPNKFEKHNGVIKEIPVVEQTDIVNITVKPDIVFDDFADENERMDTEDKQLVSVVDESIVVKLEKDNDDCSKIEFERDVKIKMEPPSINSDEET